MPPQPPPCLDAAPESESSSTWHYSAFGLRFDSAVAIRSFAEAPPGPADVVVRWGQVPTSLDDASVRFPAFEASQHTLLLKTGSRLRLLIRDGCEIVVDGYTVSNHDHLELWLISSAVAAILHQRGLLALHASAVLVGNELVVFTGDRGAGKSTLMSALAQRGFPCVADDILAISWSPDPGTPPQAFVGLTQARLWRESASLLGVDVHGCPKVAPAIDKHLVTWPAASPAPYPIRAIYRLCAEQEGPLEVSALSPLRAVEALVANVYRPGIARALGCNQRIFEGASAVARHASVVQVRRPSKVDTLAPIVTRVLHDLGQPTLHHAARGDDLP